jgi:hypothetical protein
MFCPLPGAGYTVLFLVSSPHTFTLKMISSMVVLALHGEVTKTLPLVLLATHKLIVSVDAVVGVELLATTPTGKHISSVLPKYVLASYLQRHDSFVTDITGVNPLSLSCALSPHTGPIQKQNDSPHKPALNTCSPVASRCAPLFMFSLKLILVFKMMRMTTLILQ